MDTKKLRQKILDLAIRGKLVPQDPNDEPASVLLERIKAEKERLIKEGKIKRTKKTAKTSDTPHYQQDVPFEVPSNWVWTTVNNISKSILYGVSESAKPKGKYKLLRITDIQDNQVNWNTVPFTDFDEYKVSSYILRDGDIVFARTGATVGKSYLIKGLIQKAIYASYLIRVQTYDLILPEYIKLFFESGYYWQQIQLSSVGIGQPNVNGTILGNLNLPLPPYAEQKRIVAEIERWLSFIDIIEKEKGDLQTIVKQTKSKILDLAIHGKLVPQDPNDEPAIELLKRINPDFTPCDNGHSEKLPQGWVSITINDICSIIGGVSYNKADIQDTGIRVLRGGNIQRGKVLYCSDDVFIPLSYQNDENQIQYGDIIVVASTGSQTLIGKTAFVDRDIPKTQIGAFLRIVRPKQNVLSPYLRLIFQTDTYRNYIRNVAKGSNINNVKNIHLQNYQICLPPLAEQKRIVSNIKELFSTLDNILKALEA